MIFWYCSGKQKGAIYRFMFARTITFTVKKKGRANKLPLVILNKVCNYDYSGTDIISLSQNNARVFFIKMLFRIDFTLFIYKILPLYSYLIHMWRPKKRFTLSERLKIARAEKNLTVDALTKASWVQYITYSKIEQWVSQSPTLANIIRVARVLWVTVDELAQDMYLDN